MTNDKPRTRSQHDSQHETESTDEPGPRTRARAAATTAQTAPTTSAATSSTSRRKDKGKHKQLEPDTRPAKRPRRSAPAATTAPAASTATASTSLSINEPKRDPKGKKRAAPDPDSDDAATSSKKHKSPYSLRTRSSLPNSSKTPTTMPRKNRATRKSTSSKSQTRADDDVIDFGADTRPEGESNLAESSRKDKAPERHESDEDDDEDSDDEDDDQDQEPPSSGLPPSGLDESAVSALFGADFRALGSYMLSLSSRLKTILNNIKPAASATTRLMALQELSEILSMSTEDTLAGYFQVDSFVAELVRIMGGKGSGDDDDEGAEDDEDASLAAAIALSAGGAFPGDDNLEAQVLACRCLANLMEALPGCAHTVVYHGAVPVLCSKLIDIQYIDLAEQTLSTLEKISQDDSSAIVREGGLAALLNFLDFFSTNVQRTALQAAANCCRNVSADNYSMVKDVFPIIRTVLGYADPRLVEYASLCVIRTIESFRGHPELLEGLVDTVLLRALSSATVSPGTFTLILRALSSATKASPKITLALLEADVAGTLYQILTGVVPPADGQDACTSGEGAVTGAAGAGGLTDMAVMQNLAHRPKDQVEEALSLVSELMPPLPRDGVFDHRAYSEKALARMVKAKIKALKNARNSASAGPSNSADTSMLVDTGAEGPGATTPVAGPVLDPQDAITLRAKVVRFKYMSGGEDSGGDPVLERLRGLLATLRDAAAGEAELKDAVKGIASLFTGGTGASVSSYELLKSGLVDGLLQFTTDSALALDVTARQLMVLQAFAVRSGKGSDSPSSTSPFAVLVKKLQESLTRIENFEVVTVSPGAEASRRNSASMLARQLRLRIVAEEGTDAPRSCSNIVVSIHAIATFQALNDYLRPRVAGALAGMSAGGSRLSGVLAAFAAAAGLPAGALGRVAASAGAGTGAGSSAAASSSAPTVGRRRSQRLKAKDNTASGDAGEENTSPTTDMPAASSSAPAPPFSAASGASSALDMGLPPPSAMLAALAAGGDPGIPMMSSEDYDMEHAEDMLNEDFEAEFYEEDMEPQHATPDKTVSVALTDDGTKVEAQTPDGTRVATPNPSAALERLPTGTPSSSASKFSYATALKTKPTDWHLEFSMDGHVLPLDTTIYGAVHHHEARRAAAAATASGSASGPSAGIAALSAPSLWQGVYTVKYKKVPGPPPTQSGGRVEAVPTSESTLSADSAHIQILRLLRVLHKMNLMAKDRVAIDTPGVVLPESAFINNKLTAKLTRQLEEPMIVASQCLPDWAMELPQQYYFLFPFSTRFSFLQSTSFGYARLITKWQSQQQRSSDSSRRDDAFGYLGRLQRQKVRISRHHILESAAKVLELYGSSSSVLEVEYFEEPGGKDTPVTDSNVEEYVREVIDAVIGRGVQTQTQAFRAGFSKVFPATDLQSFSSDELDLLFGNAEEDWTAETLTEALKADHGFNVDSSAIRDLISVMSSYDESARRAFLQFITGSPKLPIGGFRGLSPQLTVVRKPHEPPLKADDYLPSVMTCVNYLKLPEYSTKSVMEARLKTAMMEGVGSFHLS
ncbi:Ubiquitin fusion degradation protein 4 [Ceratobasidium sp. UAMH 11750]|nr:Ubiquitin fusion degradation protein 4 [Ceratobasidium sp. UAMH 11750]